MTGDRHATVVVCTYSDERWEHLETAMESVRRQTLPAAQIILVVDHNPSLLERSRARFPWAQVMPNSGRRGLSDGRNTGLAAAEAPVVAFLDDDAEAECDWLERLLHPYVDPAVLAVGGRTEARWERARPAWFPGEFDWVVGCTYVGVRTDAGPVRNVLGANMSFRRDVLNEIGGFERSLGRVGAVPLGCEETEACLRARACRPNGLIWYEPHAVVHHSVPEARGRWKYYRSRCWAEGLSKARLSTLAGHGAALAAERRYAAVVLPQAVATDLRVVVREPRRAARVGAVALGLGITSAGYARGRLRERRLARPRLAPATR